MNKRILSGIMGLAIGDALGVPVEFKSRASLKARPIREMRGFGAHNQPAGTWSDDTSMTLALAESLASRDEIDYQDIMNNFSAWLREGRFTPNGKAFDIGRTTVKAIQRFDDGIEPRLAGSTGEFDNGNGSLMRTLPLAFYLRQRFGPGFSEQDEAFDIVHQVSALTHAHPRSMIACGIYVAIAGRLLGGGSLAKGIRVGLEQARAYYERHPEFAAAWRDYARLLDLGFGKLPESEIRSSGHVVDTLEAAVWCLLNTQSYPDCVLKAVNLGEDTDTVAAVAGGLAGLAYGFDAIPQEWLQALAQRAEIEEACHRLALAMERIAVRRLCRFLPYFETATSESICPIGAGQVQGEDIYALPYPRYEQTMNGFVEAFTQSSLFDPDFLDLTGQLAFDNPQELAEVVDTADLALVKAILTGFVRQERFCDGIWAEAMDSRLFYRILRRLALLEGVGDCLQPA